jgi:hypothetical protein
MVMALSYQMEQNTFMIVMEAGRNKGFGLMKMQKLWEGII